MTIASAVNTTPIRDNDRCRRFRTSESSGNVCRPGLEMSKISPFVWGGLVLIGFLIGCWDDWQPGLWEMGGFIRWIFFRSRFHVPKGYEHWAVRASQTCPKREYQRLRTLNELEQCYGRSRHNKLRPAFVCKDCGKYSGFNMPYLAGILCRMNVSKPPQQKFGVCYHPISFQDDHPNDTRGLWINLGCSHILAQQDALLSAVETGSAPTDCSIYSHHCL